MHLAFVNRNLTSTKRNGASGKRLGASDKRLLNFIITHLASVKGNGASGKRLLNFAITPRASCKRLLNFVITLRASCKRLLNFAITIRAPGAKNRASRATKQAKVQIQVVFHSVQSRSTISEMPNANRIEIPYKIKCPFIGAFLFTYIHPIDWCPTNRNHVVLQQVPKFMSKYR